MTITRDQRLRSLALVLFFLSGIAGLIYQVVWTKLLTLTMGNSMLSIATVVTAFMAGLALGSYVAGRIAHRLEHPLLVFGLLEGTVGAYCLLIPGIIALSEPLFRFVYQEMGPEFLAFRVIQFFITGAILLLPTTLMGATLPVLSTYVTESLEDVGWSVGRLYAINTFGAVVGAFGTGFLIIPWLGLQKTIFTGATLNLGIAAVVVMMHFRQKGREAKQGGEKEKVKEIDAGPVAASLPVREPLGGARLVVLYLCFGLSGFAAMSYQIGWTRVLSLVFGPSVYAFSLTVATFILGLAVGAILAARIVDRVRDLYGLLAVVVALVGLLGLFVMARFGSLPMDLVDLYLEAEDLTFESLELHKFWRAFALMLPPTILMGAVFPIAARILARDLSRVGRAVGTAYSVNTVGSILGSFLTGFVILPWLGIQGALTVGVVLNLVVALFLVAAAFVLRKVERPTVVAALFLPLYLLTFLVPPFRQEFFHGGAYLYARAHREELEKDPSRLWDLLLGGTRVIFHKEGITTTVAVLEVEGGLRAMRTSGKTDSSSGRDMTTQVLATHIPMLVHPDPRQVCIIGLGSGVSLGSAGCYPIEHADCIEISAEVAEAAAFFKKWNNDALSEPERLRVIIEDGRNHLKLSGRKYDVVMSEPTNPWIVGVGSLFTREFFEAARGCLEPGGVMCQWINIYNLGHEEFRMVVKTFQEVFPRTMLWEALIGADYLLVGVPDGARLDAERFREAFTLPRIRQDLERIGVFDAEGVLKHFVLGPEAVIRYCAGAPVHTDDNTILEYSLPRSLYLTQEEQTKKFETFVSALQSLRGTPLTLLDFDRVPDDAAVAMRARVEDFYRARLLCTQGYLRNLTGDQAASLELYREAALLDPRDVTIRNAAAQILLDLGTEALVDQGDYEGAKAHFVEALGYDPDSVTALKTRAALAGAANFMGKKLLSLGYADAAMVEFGAVLETDPGNEEARLGVVDAHLLRQDTAEARRILDDLRRTGASNPDVLLREGKVCLWEGKGEAARLAFEGALAQDADRVDVRHALATTLRLEGKRKKALEQYDRIAQIDPSYAPAWVGVGTIYLEMGELARASSALRQAIALDPLAEGAGGLAYHLMSASGAGGDLETSLLWAEQVLRFGVLDPASLRQDPAAVPLRGDARFERLLSSFEERARSGQGAGS